MYRLSRGLQLGALSALLMAGHVALGNAMSLLDAAKEGNFAALQAAIKARSDVNSALGDGTTALAWAVYNNDLDAVDLLIRSGADVNAADDLGVTSLSLACQNSNANITSKLLEAGADPDLAKVTGVTPLMECANVGAVEALELLLAHEADVNARENKKGQTALMWAAAERHPDVVQMLVSNGADVHARSREIPEPEPFIIKIAKGQSVWGSNYPHTVRFPRISGGFTALYFAAQQGDLESAKILIKAGADINSPHPEHGSPLVIAIASGHEELGMYLLESGADPNIRDAWGVSPLHYALHRGVLILNSFKKPSSNGDAWVPRDMPRLVEALLDHGADPDARIEYSFPFLDHVFTAVGDDLPPQIDPVGATPLLVAAASGNVEAMNLLEEVSDVKAKTIGGATLFMLASGAGSERGARNEKEALEAARLALSLGGGSVNDVLTELAPDGPAKGVADGRTALHFAVTVGWTDMIRFLVENGADINARDRYGVTPMMVALGDPEGRYYRNVGDGDYDHRYRRSTDNAGISGDKRLADLLLELGAEPFTGKYRDLSGQ